MNRLSLESADSSPIVKKKIGEQVFERILDQIDSGILSPGDYMPSERELMRQYNVGRPAIREAMQLLHTKGLIVISQGERSKVNQLSARTAFQQIDDVAKLLLSQEPSNLDNLKQLRRLFELGVVELAAKKCKIDDIDDLEQILSEQKSLTGNAPGFIKQDIIFHARIAEISGNPLLKVVSEAMLSWVFEYHSSLLHWSGKEETTLLEHERIISYLAANDPEGAVDIMKAHLDRSDPLMTGQSSAPLGA